MATMPAHPHLQRGFKMFIHVLYFATVSILLSISIYAFNTPIHKVGKDETEKPEGEEGSTQQS
jgi:hypothetical protein